VVSQPTASLSTIDRPTALGASAVKARD
jgi:hypothetical protein